MSSIVRPSLSTADTIDSDVVQMLINGSAGQMLVQLRVAGWIEATDGRTRILNSLLAALLSARDAAATPVIAPDDQLRVAAYQHAVRHGQATDPDCACQLVRADGSLIAVLLTTSCLVFAGQPPVLLTLVRPDSAAPHVRGELTLAQLDLLITEAPIGIALVDTDLRFVRINASLAAMNQLSVAAHIGHRAREILPEYASIWEQYWRRVLDTGVAVTDVEIHSEVDNRVADALVSYYPVRAADGRVLGVGCIVQNITERKRIERASELIAQLSQMLAATVGYEDRAAQINLFLTRRIASYSMLLLQPDEHSPHLRWDTAGNTGDPERLAALQTEIARDAITGITALGGVVSAQHEALLTAHEATLPAGVETAAVLPLTARGTPIGVLILLQEPGYPPLAAEHRELYREIAERCALALDNARLLRDSQQMLKRYTQTFGLLQALLENAPVGISFFDADLRYLLVGSDLARLNQLPAIDHIGLRVADVAPYAAAQVDPLMRRVLETGEPVLTEIIVDTNGNPDVLIGYFLTFYALHDETGHISGVGSVGIDISALKRFEARQSKLLEQTERSALQLARLQQVTSAFAYATSADAISAVFIDLLLPTIDAHGGGIGLLNERGDALMLACTQGYPEALIELFQITPIDAPVPYADCPRRNIALWYESGAALAVDYPLLRDLPDGPPPGASIHLPLRADKRVIGVLAIQYSEVRGFSADDRVFIELLTEQCARALERSLLYASEQTARARAERAVAVRDEFLAIATHEIRTPLTTILGQAGLLQRRLRAVPGLTPQHERALDTIIAQGQRLATMITDLLDVSRLESGQLQIAYAGVELVELVRRALENIRATTPGRTFLLFVETEHLLVTGDALRLEQVLGNLLNNAIKYSAEQSQIEVTLARVDQRALIHVQDYGIGIAADALPHLFDRFYRVDNEQTRNVTGVGVGLFVVHEIVRLHGGQVSINSTPGAGSTFTVTLPLA